MQPPGRLEEEAAVRRDGRVLAEEVRERGTIGAGRVRALRRLVQLLRIAQQDEAVGGARHGDDIGQGDLAGLVDEEHVDGIAHAGRGPQPRGTRGEVGASVVAGVRGRRRRPSL